MLAWELELHKQYHRFEAELRVRRADEARRAARHARATEAAGVA